MCARAHAHTYVSLRACDRSGARVRTKVYIRTFTLAVVHRRYFSRQKLREIENCSRNYFLPTEDSLLYKSQFMKWTLYIIYKMRASWKTHLICFFLHLFIRLEFWRLNIKYILANSCVCTQKKGHSWFENIFSFNKSWNEIILC